MSGDLPTLEAIAAESDAGVRLDKFCVQQWPDHSRARLQELIKSGDIRVNGEAARPSRPLEAGEVVTAVLRPKAGPQLPPEPMELEVLHDDPAFLVINKPPRLAVHPGPGQSSGTLVNGLLAMGGHWSEMHEDPLRPGIVHRLDRDTSGAIIVARDEQAHAKLAKQFEQRTVDKEYLALVTGVPEHDEFTVDVNIARDPKQRQKMVAKPAGGPEGRTAFTRFRVKERFRGFAAVAAFPKTGRTHQIRVHLQHHGTPCCCDAYYNRFGERLTVPMLHGQPSRRTDERVLDRLALHARRIHFDHPVTGERITVAAPIPADLMHVVEVLRELRGT
ncbi:MAG: RluA family pseudouridine synthase [Planctomycetota bacterium]